MTRAYTYAELERMRSALYIRILDASDFGVEVRATQARVEDELRTLILAGVSPEDLERKT